MAYIPEYFILPLMCVLFVNSWSIATSCPHMHKIFNSAYGDGFSSTFTAACVVLQNNNKTIEEEAVQRLSGPYCGNTLMSIASIPDPQYTQNDDLGMRLQWIWMEVYTITSFPGLPMFQFLITLQCI